MSWQTPDTHHTAGIERGTVTSISTRPGTTSAGAVAVVRRRTRYGTTGEPNQLDVALAEVKHSARPLVLGATLMEVVAAGATIASKLPTWSISGTLVGVPLAAFALHQYRKANAATVQLVQLYHYSRRYTRYVTSVYMFRSDDPNYWSAIHHNERELVAIRPVRQFTYDMTRRSDIDTPFEGAKLSNQHANRSGAGDCIFHAFHKSKSNLAFRIEFDPPLRPGESATVAFDVHIPRFKVGNLALLRARPRPKIPVADGLDYSSTDISYPIEEFVKELVIVDDLRTTHHRMQAVSDQDDFPEEKSYLESTGGFSISPVKANGTNATCLKIERNRPPIGTTYRLLWEPPDI